MSAHARITSFLIKIASRCNLACDYCYVYQHADQSWRDMPSLMDERTRRQVAARIGEYATAVGLQHLLLVFHGGEPLLAGHARIVETADWVRAAVPRGTRVDVAVQTNGLLLDEVTLTAFERGNISVSVSIDGPPRIHDLHRVTHGGGPSHAQTLEAIRRLEAYPSVYAGLIAVIDPRVKPDALLEYFEALNAPRVDFLLPDANHGRAPPGRDGSNGDPDLYVNWMLRAFDVWFDRYPEVRVRTFDALLEAIAGLPSGTDAFGLGDVSLLTIETDGSYHDLDVLKIARHGATHTGVTVWDGSVEQAAATDQIRMHRRALTLEGLSHECRVCPEVKICGGGAVPHRFADDGYVHPTVYCREMLSLIRHAKRRVSSALLETTTSGPSDALARADLALFDDAARGKEVVNRLQRRFADQVAPLLTTALRASAVAAPDLRQEVDDLLAVDEEEFRHVATQPSAVLWASVVGQHATGRALKDIDGTTMPADFAYVRVMHGWIRNGLTPSPRIHRADPYLRMPFGKRIVFEPAAVAEDAAGLISEALEIIERFDPAVASEIRRISPEIQLIRDPTAHPDKAVSFSDNTVPGALFVSVRRGSTWIGPHDLADSIVHEHRHQKLYLLQATSPLVAVDAPLVPSPWRDDMRPPSGLFHAVYVFCGLLRYWRFVENVSEGALKEYAAAEVARIRGRLQVARPTLFTTALTDFGEELAKRLYDGIDERHMDGRIS